MMTPEPKPIDLSIVIPAFNEEERLRVSLPRVLEYLRGREMQYEVLVVDDGSRDRTAEVARGYSNTGVEALSLERNQGKGGAVRHGVLASRGQRVLITDADLSTPIEDLEVLEAELAMGSTGIAIGSRALDASQIQVHQPLYRELMGKSFNRLVGLLALRGIRDTQCGFKLLEGNTARELFAEVVTRGFSFDVELLFLARRRGFEIREVAVRWKNHPDSKVHPLIDPLRMLGEILRFRFHHARFRGRRPSSLASDE